MHYAKVVQTDLDQTKLAKVVTCAYLFHEIFSSLPHRLYVNQVKLLQVVWHLTLQNRSYLLNSALIDCVTVTLNR